jgi:hypothetical protein
MHKRKTLKQKDINNQHKQKWENSWYLRTGVVHNFICRCGQHDTIINLTIIHHPDHICSKCRNTHYLDSVMFVDDTKVKIWSSFYWSYEGTKDDTGWHIDAVARIPFFDYTLQKIVVKKVLISSKSLLFNGEIKNVNHSPNITGKYVYQSSNILETIEVRIKRIIGKNLTCLVVSNPIDKINVISSEDIKRVTSVDRLNVLAFFLKHHYLKEFDFFYWKNFAMFGNQTRLYPTVKEMLAYIFNQRSEKSIKKAYFSSYMVSMSNGYYNPVSDFIFARTIKDRNYLVQLISIDSEIKLKMFDETAIDEVIRFSSFLSKHYSERSIVKIWHSIGYYELTYNILRDTLRMFSREHNQRYIEENFIKPKATLNSIHDEFIRLVNLQEQLIQEFTVYDYSEAELLAEVEYEGLEYRLPKNVLQLQQWATKLRNCMASYSADIYGGRSTIYGVFKNDKILYAIELKGHRIVQSKSVRNGSIETQEKEKIDRWFREVYIKEALNLNY